MAAIRASILIGVASTPESTKEIFLLGFGASLGRYVVRDGGDLGPLDLGRAPAATTSEEDEDVSDGMAIFWFLEAISSGRRWCEDLEGCSRVVAAKIWRATLVKWRFEDLAGCSRLVAAKIWRVALVLGCSSVRCWIKTEDFNRRWLYLY